MTGWRAIFPGRAVYKLISVGHGGASIITMRNSFDETSPYHAMPTRITRNIRILVRCKAKRNNRNNQSDNKKVGPSHKTPRAAIKPKTYDTIDAVIRINDLLN